MGQYEYLLTLGETTRAEKQKALVPLSVCCLSIYLAAGPPASGCVLGAGVQWGASQALALPWKTAV